MCQLEASVKSKGCALPGIGAFSSNTDSEGNGKALTKKVGGWLGNESKSLV